MKDLYEKFAYDYDEFGSIENYLGSERSFFQQLFTEYNVECDFRYLERAFAEQFDAVVCLTTSLPHLHTDEDLVTALQSMKDRLRTNGLLVLTQGTTPYTLSLPPIEVVDLYHSKERLESSQYDIVYKIILDDDYRRLLSEAGFGNIQIYGDYDRSPYSEESRRLIVVAQG